MAQTEVGIAAPGLAHSSYSADGNASGATLARFQVTGGPGSNMVFRPPNPIKVDVSHLIGGTIDQVKGYGCQLGGVGRGAHFAPSRASQRVAMTLSPHPH
eukprot:COSAG02_NODE_2406_length_8930_cov_10.414676_2_plen_100_part_00